jgi:pimeloyl-ACP methyl ester carboxylesterase
MSEATLLAGFRPHFAEIEGRRMRYFTAGAGKPLVLVHGLGGAAVNWSELAPLLAHRHRVIVPDLPGHGGSEGISDGVGLGAFADWVAALLELEGARPAAVAGHSMGGVVALRLAVRHPESVAGLALLGSAGISSTTRSAEVFFALAGRLRPAKQAARLRHLVAARPRLRRLVFGYWGAADPAALSPQSVLGFLQGAAAATDVATAARALLRDDPRSDLDRVRCPSLIVWGARDRLAPLVDGFEYARRLRAPLRTLPGTGHLLIAEHPAECAAILEGFLDAWWKSGPPESLPERNGTKVASV